MVQITNCLCLKGLPRGCKPIMLCIFLPKEEIKEIHFVSLCTQLFEKQIIVFFFATNISVEIIIFILK